MDTQRKITASQGFFYTPTPFITMKVSVKKIYSNKKMKQALLKLEEAHPTINNVIEKTENEMFFKDVGKHVELTEFKKSKDTTWEKVMEEIAKRTVNLEEQSGIIFYVVKNVLSFELIIACHHIYGDGLSVKQLMDDLLYIYSTGKKVDVKVPKPDLTEKDLNKGCSIPKELKGKLVSVSKLWGQKKTVFTFDTYRTVNDFVVNTGGYGFSKRTIKKSELKKLKKKCKELGVTINSVLTTAMVAVLQENGGIESVIAVNARNVLGVSDDKSVSNYSSCLKPYLSYDETVDFWTNVKNIDSKIKELRNDNAQVLETLHTFMELDADILGAAYHARCGLYRDIDMLKSIKSALGTSDNSFDISNIGEISFENNMRNKRAIKDCYFSPNLATTCNYAFGVMSVNNSLTISLGYKNKIIQQEQAEKAMDSIVKYLK